MAPRHIFAVFACAMFVAMTASASADDYRAGELFDLDLSKAVLSPKRLGPPAEFAPVPVEARTDSKQVVAEPKADHQRVVRTTRVTRQAHVEPQARVEKPRTPARAKLARRHSNPLDAQAMDRSIQTWPCKSGGICAWKR
jgi:hypothetical protein